MKPQQLLIDLVEQFCVYQQKQRGKTEGGVTTYRWNLDQFLVFVRKREGRPARVGDLSPETVQAWMDQMVAADLALSTMRARQSTLSSLSARLVKRSPAHRHDADLCDDPASAAQACGRLLRGQGCAHVERLERFFESRRRQDFRNGTLDRRTRDSNAERDARNRRDRNQTRECGLCFRTGAGTVPVRAALLALLVTRGPISVTGSPTATRCRHPSSSLITRGETISSKDRPSRVHKFVESPIRSTLTMCRKFHKTTTQTYPE